MEDLEIINLWKKYDTRLEKSLLVNQKHVEDITKLKVRSLLNSMTPLKIFTIVTGILWVGLIAILIANLFTKASTFFILSAGIQISLTSIAILIYVYQLILIQQVDISEPILAALEKTVHLKLSTLWIGRILFLQLPVWTTFYLTKTTLINASTPLLIVQTVVTFSFAFLSLWLFVNIKYDNRNKKWFKILFNGNEWNPVIKSIKLLEQINDYKMESPDSVR